MDALFTETIRTAGPTAAVALVALWLVDRVMDRFSKALDHMHGQHTAVIEEQRKDFLRELKEVRGTCLRSKAALALLSLILIPGCVSGNGGTLSDFSLTTALGSLSWKAWQVGPTEPPPAASNPTPNTTTRPALTQAGP